LFLKRLRKSIAPQRIRFFACGEYGEKTSRPHYHAVLFGLSARDCYSKGRFLIHPAVAKAWSDPDGTPIGYTSAGELNPHRASYVSQYVTKKYTRPDDDWTARQLAGRPPEFMRSSRRPGIGALHVDAIAEALLIANPTAEDIPTSFVLDGKTWPLSNFLAAKVREALGIPLLARDRPPKPEKPPDEFVELVSGSGTLGVMTRRVSRTLLEAAQAESKLNRKRKRKIPEL